MKFHKTILANGVRVLTEQHPHTMGVSLGVWVNLGSRDEPPAMAGISHLIEHLVFKGTLHFSAFEIAKSLEQLGGELNAFTTRESICFHAYVLKEHWKVALNVLYELTSLMKITSKDFKLEKSVIIQEIAMSEDQPEELIYDRFLEKVYRGNGLSLPIAGTVKSVLEMKKKDVEHYYKDHFRNEKILISLTGDVPFQEVVQECNIRFTQPKRLKNLKKKVRKKPQWKAFHEIIEKKIDNSHVLLGFPSASFKSSLRFESLIMNALIGGGMTSRLYQSIREKRGLVYSIYSQLVTHADSGAFMLYASTETENIESVTNLMFKEIQKLVKKSPTQKELNHFKTQIVGQIRLNSEDIENRMNSLAINEIIFQDYKSVDWVVEQIQKVSLNSIEQWKNKYLDLTQLSGILITSDQLKERRWWDQLFN